MNQPDLSHDQSAAQSNPMQPYYDWQLTTLMLAYDLKDPIPQEDEQRAQQRREEIGQELSELVRSVLPQEHLDDPSRSFDADLMMKITRATLQRAAEIAEL